MVYLPLYIIGKSAKPKRRTKGTINVFPYESVATCQARLP